MSALYFVIGMDGRPHGPLSPDEIRTWIADGRAGRYSRLRREGESEWRALQELPDFDWSLKEPVVFEPPAGETPGDTSVQGQLDAMAAAYSRTARTVTVTESFGRAWTLITRHYVELASWSLLAGIIALPFTFIPPPRVGLAASIVINGILTGATSFVYLSRIRGRRASMAEVTAALAATAWNLCLAVIAQALLMFAGLLLLIVPGLYLAVGFAFALPLTIDKRIPFWMALEVSRRVVQKKQWWAIFGVMLGCTVLFLSSYITRGLTLVIAVPLSTAALMYAYEDLFGAQGRG